MSFILAQWLLYFSLWIALSTELLSLVQGITRLNVLFFWIFLLVFLIIKRKKIFIFLSNLSRYKLFLPISGFVFFIGLIALVAAPNNYDSMTYHLPRVVYWIQQHSLQHYPTNNLRQLFQPPFAEYVILHLQLLVGSDFLANLVQFVYWLGSLLLLWTITGQLGGERKAQWFGVVLGLTLPMAILQATGTQNNLVLNFFFLMAVVLLLKKDHSYSGVFWFGASVGLGLLTKGTGYIFMAPVVVWYGFDILRQQKFQAIGRLFLMGLIILLINSGHYSRNYGVWGHPLGSTAADRAGYTNSHIDPGTLLSNTMRGVLLHCGTPIGYVNEHLYGAVRFAHRLLRLDLNDPGLTWRDEKLYPPNFNTNEDTAGNLLHLLLITIVLAWGTSQKIFTGDKLKVLLLLLISVAFFSLYLRWQPWNTRIDLPLFYLALPLVAFILGKLESRYYYLFLIVLFFQTLPFVLRNETRLVFSSKESILFLPRARQYFSANSGREATYLKIINYLIADSRSTFSLGLVFGENTYEYPLMALLKSGGKNVRYAHIVNSQSLEKIGFDYVLAEPARTAEATKLLRNKYMLVLKDKGFELYKYKRSK